MPIETPPNQDYDPEQDPDTGPPATGADDDTTTDDQAEGEDE